MHRQRVILRLTALWGLGESGLGGWMHALHLPFTGIFVGGFAVVLIALIAWYSGFHFTTILRATLLVLLVKAAVSPQSPPAAYLAVAFQGLTGAALFSLLRNYRIAALLLCILAMAESALQKIIVATLIFGTDLWEATDRLFLSVVRELGLASDISFSYGILISYVLLYVVWGIVLGLWIGGLPGRISEKAVSVSAQLKSVMAADMPEQKLRRKGKYWRRLAWYLIILLGMIGVFLWSEEGMANHKAIYLVVRTVAVLALLMGVIRPLVQWCMAVLLRRYRHRPQSELQKVMTVLPELHKIFRSAYALALQERRGWKRYTYFIFVLIVATLHPETVET